MQCMRSKSKKLWSIEKLTSRRYVYFVIPENIHTSPMEGMFCKTPPTPRVVSRFWIGGFIQKLGGYFHFISPISRSELTLLTFRVTSAVFKIAGDMRRLPAYFDNPAPLWKFHLSFIHFFKFFGLTEPPPRKFQSLLWGRMDIFWNCTFLENYSLEFHETWHKNT